MFDHPSTIRLDGRWEFTGALQALPETFMTEEVEARRCLVDTGAEASPLQVLQIDGHAPSWRIPQTCFV
jgi:hypothetical protein